MFQDYYFIKINATDVAISKFNLLFNENVMVKVPYFFCKTIEIKDEKFQKLIDFSRIEPIKFHVKLAQNLDISNHHLNNVINELDNNPFELTMKMVSDSPEETKQRLAEDLLIYFLEYPTRDTIYWQIVGLTDTSKAFFDQNLADIVEKVEQKIDMTLRVDTENYNRYGELITSVRNVYLI